MSKTVKSKFYMPGTLEVPGTKITLKTQPYMNGVIFNMNDPISSFRSYIALMNMVINNYEYIMNIPGLANSLPECVIREEDLGKLKLLLNYLAESPTEIILKQQNITQEILNDMEIRN